MDQCGRVVTANDIAPHRDADGSDLQCVRAPRVTLGGGRNRTNGVDPVPDLNEMAETNGGTQLGGRYARNTPLGDSPYTSPTENIQMLTKRHN